MFGDLFIIFVFEGIHLLIIQDTVINTAVHYMYTFSLIYVNSGKISGSYL